MTKRRWQQNTNEQKERRNLARMIQKKDEIFMVKKRRKIALKMKGAQKFFDNKQKTKQKSKTYNIELLSLKTNTAYLVFLLFLLCIYCSIFSSFMFRCDVSQKKNNKL